jgi:hypothetical protein
VIFSFSPVKKMVKILHLINPKNIINVENFNNSGVPWDIPEKP